MTHQTQLTQSEHVSENHEARPQAPEAGKIQSALTHAKSALLALSIGAASSVAAQDSSEGVQVADASGGVVVANLEGEDIDYDINSLSSNDINEIIAQINMEIAALDAKEELAEADFIQLDKLEEKKDSLQDQLVVLEESKQSINAEAIEDLEEIKDSVGG